MRNRKITSKVLLNTWEDLDIPLFQLKDWLDNAAEEIGADAQTAKFFFETESDYEGGCIVRGYVYRLETDQECAEREAKEAQYSLIRAEEAQRRERLLYEKLKAKYG